MKRIMILILPVILLLCGCQIKGTSVTDAAPTTQAPTITPDATDAVTNTEEPMEATNPPQYQSYPMVAVSMPLETESTLSDTGSLVFYHRYQTMQIISQDPEVANACIIDYLNRLDSIQMDIKEYRDAALQNFSEDANWTPYFCDVLYSPCRIDSAVLSLHGSVRSYNGGRVIPVYTSANYDMLTGDVLTLGSILQHVDSKSALQALVIEQADNIAIQAQLYDDYAAFISERFDREESFDEDWYFTDTGLCFYFSPYEIAPYSAGLITLEVPYSALTGIIADEFFPPETEPMAGTLQAQLLNDVNPQDYEQIAELVLHSEGEQFLLSVDGAIQNIRVEVGTWDETSTVFLPDAVVFATPVLTGTDAVMIQTYVPDVLPALRISYISNGSTVIQYLFQSGEDGSAILLEE